MKKVYGKKIEKITLLLANGESVDIEFSRFIKKPTVGKILKDWLEVGKAVPFHQDKEDGRVKLVVMGYNVGSPEAEEILQ